MHFAISPALWRGCRSVQMAGNWPLQLLRRRGVRLSRYSRNGFCACCSSELKSSSLHSSIALKENGFQTTLESPVTLSGVGLHGGEHATVRLTPAMAGEGRYFVKTDDSRKPEIRVAASIRNVCDTRLSTTICHGDVAFQTIEHLMSSLEGLGVDNVRIEMTGGNEVPILDGSALLWTELILSAGLVEARDSIGSSIERKLMVLQQPIVVQEGDSYVKGFPSPQTKFSYQIDFPQIPVVGKQQFTWTPSEESSYPDAVSRARTFGILEQFEHLRSAGFIKGGSLENALVCSMTGGWVNPPLRYDDEPCRHKMLDLIGDLALCAQNGNPGIPSAEIVAFKASHALHVKFGKVLLNVVS